MQYAILPKIIALPVSVGVKLDRKQNVGFKSCFKAKTTEATAANNFSFSIGRCQNDLLDGFFHALATATQWDQIAKIRQKLDKQKLVKLIDVSNAHSNLTNFEYDVNELTGNGNYVNVLNFDGKICEISSGELIFGGFYPLGTTVCYYMTRLFFKA